MVTGVTATASCGWIFKEFGYNVRVIYAPSEVLDYEQVEGREYIDVFESCLYDL